MISAELLKSAAKVVALQKSAGFPYAMPPAIPSGGSGHALGSGSLAPNPNAITMGHPALPSPMSTSESPGLKPPVEPTGMSSNGLSPVQIQGAPPSPFSRMPPPNFGGSSIGHSAAPSGVNPLEFLMHPLRLGLGNAGSSAVR